MMNLMMSFMKASTKIISTAIVIIILLGCSKESEFVVPTGHPNSPEGNFDAFWHGIDQNYLFFEHQTLNWDNVYRTYRQKVTANTSQNELKQILKEMLDLLIDGHKKIEFDSTDSYNGLAFDRETFRMNFAQNSASNYLTNVFTLRGNLPGSNTTTDELLIGTIKNKNMDYVCVRFFGNALDNVSQRNQLHQFITAGSTKKGLILDLRNNTGGQATAFYNLVSCFVSGNYAWGYSRFRISRNRYELSPFLEERIQGANLNGTPNIVILINKNSASAAELTAIALKATKNTYIIGSTTFGATGPLSEFVKYTGNFYLPNKWKITLAQRMTYDKNKRLHEGTGFPPDFSVLQDLNAFVQSGTDNVLDAAIQYLDK